MQKLQEARAQCSIAGDANTQQSFLLLTSVSETIRKPPLVKAQNAIKKQTKKIKCGEKRFSIWLMEFLHPAMWHDHDIDFAR